MNLKKIEKDLVYIVLRKSCMSCGKKFMVRIRAKDGHIMDGARYFGKLIWGLGMWSKYKMGKNPDGSIKWIRIVSYQRELWYRLIDLKRKILHQYTEAEMWECPKCMMKVKRHSQSKSLRKSLTSSIPMKK